MKIAKATSLLMHKYEQLSILGEGSYGVVMKCRHRPTFQHVAVKKFLETEEDANSRKVAIREIRMLKKLKHENLVTMIEAFRHRKRFYIVFEFVEHTLMEELEKAPLGLGEPRCKERIFQVLRGIGYCHKNRIVHRDVKPENILVSSRGLVKLCDFGFARILSVSRELYTQYVATRWYRAPELLVGERYYGTPVDIWAIGCLFAEMVIGQPIFPGDTDIDQLHLIVKMLGKPCARHQKLLSKNVQFKSILKGKLETAVGVCNFFSDWPLPAIQFLDRCLKMDPQKRLTADDLLKLNYFVADGFSKKFLASMRERVEMEFNNPLLRSYKEEILRSTDKSDSVEHRRMSQIPSAWSIVLTDNHSKRKKLTK